MTQASSRIYLFGGLRVEQGDRVIDRFRTHKTAALLAYLACHPDREHDRESLAELLWPESEGASARNNVSVALSSLRNQLEVPGIAAQSLFLGGRRTVGLNADLLTTDVSDFARHRRTAGHTTGLEQRDHLATACRLYTGPLLPDHYESWVVAERQALQAEFVRAVDSLGSLCLAAGDLTAAQALVSQAAKVEPELDALHLCLAQLLAAGGQPDEAVVLLERLVKRRTRTDDLEPAPELLDYLESLRGSTLPSTVRIETTVPAEPLPGTGAAGGTVTLAVVQAAGSLAGEVADEWTALGATHGGQPLPWSDGGVALAFGRGTDAAELAIGLTHGELQRQGVEAGAESLPKIALHTGEVGAAEAGGYESLHDQVRQLLRAGNPGQTLCSETTVVLVAGALSPGAWTQSLGLYRLRDRARPERVYQLCHADLAPNRFGALNAPTGFTDHLPHLLTRFHGRLAEQQAIEEHLLDDHARLVTITGPGGMGKTRLAIETGRRMLEAYQGAVWFVPLADIRDPALVAGALREALGIAVTAGSQPEQEVCEFLKRQPSLLIFDNYEQLVETGTGVVQQWLQNVPELAILITSRQALGLPGEIELPLPSLALPSPHDPLADTLQCDSVRLFLDRAREARPDFRIDDDNVAAVGQLCERLGGLPLAIELAAARAQVLAPAQVLARLDRALDFLVSRQRNVPERHRTLRAALDWSYELLRPDLRQAFAQLSIFVGGWTLEDAEVVCDDPIILDALTELRQCSLVTVCHGVTTRYSMLDTVRAYASELLDDDSRAALAERHLECFSALAEEARAGLEAEDHAWLERLEAEQENLRAAFDYAVEQDPTRALTLAGALWRFWLIRGHWDEARAAFEAALAQAGEVAPATLRAKAHGWLGHLAYRQGDYDAARPELEAGLSLSEEVGDQAGMGHALNELGKVAWGLGDYPEARRCYEASLAIRREVGNDWGIAASLGNLGSVAASAGDFATAVTYLEESLAIRERLQDERGAAGSLNNLGVVYRALGDCAAATERLEQSLAIRRRLHDQPGVASSLSDLGVVAQEQSNYDAARALHQESLAIRKGLGDRRGMAASFHNLGVVALATGDHQSADRWYRECIALRREIGDLRGLALGLNNLGDVAAALDDPERSKRLYAESLEIQEQLGSRCGQALALANLGLAELALQRPASARERLRAAAELVQDGTAPWLRAPLERGLGEAAAALGEHELALQHLSRSLAEHERQGDRAGLADSLEIFAALLADTGDPAQAAEALGRAGALRSAVSHPRMPADQARYRLLNEQLTARLGPEAYDDAVRRGEGTTVEGGLLRPPEPVSVTE